MKKNHRNIITIVVVICVMLLILVSLFEFNRGIAKRLESSTVETLSEISLQQQFTFNAELQNEQSSLESMAETLAIIGHNEDQIISYLGSVIKHQGFSNLIVADVRGIGLLNNRDIIDVSQKTYFEQVMQGQFIMSEPDVSVVTNEIVLTAAVPIYVNEEIDGVLIAEYTTEHLRAFLSEAFGGLSYTAVVNQNGFVMLESTDLYGVKANLYDVFNIVAIANNRSADEVLADVNAERPGSIEYTIGGLTKFADYRPVGFNKWSLITLIPAEIIENTVSSIFISMILVSLVILFGFVVLILYLMYLERTNLKMVEKTAYYDELTGLYNLSKLKIEAEKQLINNQDTEFVIIKFDFVNFKSINEMYSYEIANNALKTVKTVSDTVQDKSYMHARVGVDEFIFFGKLSLFENFEVGRFQFEDRYKSLLKGMERHLLTFRYGRYIIPKGETNIIEVINRVSLAHTSTKKEGSKLFCDYDEGFKQQIVMSTMLSNKMKDALLKNEFKVFLQSKHNIKTGEIVGAEALVRWIEDDGNMIFPNDFIPLFESNGFIVDLDKYMLGKVCSILKTWNEEGKGYLPISVNFSRRHFENTNFVDEVIAITDSFGIPHKYIEVELTETILVDKEKELEVVIKELRKHGFGISIDDFGAGYSSLGMLTNFNIDTLKMDRSFFVNNNDEERGKKVVKTIIELSHSLNMYTVAEGVEQKEQIEFLRDIECEAAQGYFYSKPIPVDDFQKQNWN